MKQLIALSLLAITFASCSNDRSGHFQPKHRYPAPRYNYSIVKIGDCEYIEMGGGNSYTLTHKGDCSNAIHLHVGR